MTIQNWLDSLANQPLAISAFLLALPVLAFGLGLSHARGAGNDAPWKYLYSLVIYAACIPGMLAATMTLYLLLFLRSNLLEANALLTFAPIVSMACTLGIAGRNVDFGPLPGFGRLSGLMAMLSLTFVVLFALSRTSIWLVFGGSAMMLVGAGAFVFALLKWGGYMFFRRRDEPHLPAPRIGIKRP